MGELSGIADELTNEKAEREASPIRSLFIWTATGSYQPH